MAGPCCKPCSRKCMIVLIVIGILFAAAGVTLLLISPAIFQQIVDKQVVLKPDSEAFNTWRDMPAATYMSFRVFDLKNPREVTSQGALPAVEEVGVLAYRESLARRDVVVHQNDTISYRQPRTFFYDASRSTISPNRTVTTINIPLLTIVYRLATLPNWVQFVLDELVEILDGPLFINKTVNEILWGYDDPLLKRIDEILKRFNISIPYQIGLFSGRNGTDDGLYNVFAGGEDVNKINSVFTWNYNLELPYWNSEYANMINGTDGTLFHPNVQTSDQIYVFTTDLCRSLYAKYVQSLRNNFDINVLRFEIPSELFADHETVPANADFCTPPGNCLKAGVLNVSVCRDGLPIIISLPHFYLADPEYQNMIVGLHPNHDDHASYFDLEPFTGAVLNASKRLQINVPLRRVEPMADMKRLPNQTFFFPVAWLTESGQLDSDLADQFKGAVYVPHTLLTVILPVCLLALGAVALLVLVAVLLSNRPRDTADEREHLVSEHPGDSRSDGPANTNANDESDD